MLCGLAGMDDTDDIVRARKRQNGTKGVDAYWSNPASPESLIVEIRIRTSTTPRASTAHWVACQAGPHVTSTFAMSYDERLPSSHSRI